MGGQELENAEALKTHRRSVYYSVYPEEGGRSALGELFDAPDALECYRRTRTIVPQQALALTNSDLAHSVSAAITARIDEQLAITTTTNSEITRDSLKHFVNLAFLRILGRTPTDAERTICLEAFVHQRDTLTAQKAADAEARARQSLVRALLNHNDFVTIR